MRYSEEKYREHFTTSVDKNLLEAFFALAKNKNQLISWLMDEALESFLRKNGMKVLKASEEK